MARRHPRPRRQHNLRLASACAVALAALGLVAVPTLHDAVPAGADTVSPSAGEFVPVPAVNIVTSANGVGWSGPIQPGQTHTITVAGVAGVPSTGVSAVLLRVGTWGSASSGDDNGNVWVWPTGTQRPDWAVVANAPHGSTADNSAFIELGTGGQISFYDGPSAQAVQVVVSVQGYVTSSASTVGGARFSALNPRRIIDTSNGTGGRSTPLTNAQTWDFHLLGSGGLPASGVSAAVINFGARGTSTNCWAQIQPTGTSQSNSSYPRVNTYATYAAQQLAVVQTNSSGNVTMSTDCPSVDLYADVEGYYATAGDESSGSIYVPMTTPDRVIDTRSGIGLAGPLTAGQVASGADAAAVTGVSDVPAGADAVALNVGTVNGTSHGYNTIWTEGEDQPTDTSTIDVDPLTPESNLVFLQTGDFGEIDVAASSSDPTESNDLYVDVEGYFLGPPLDIQPDALCATPNVSPDCSDENYTSSTTPTLTASTTDPVNARITYSFEVWTSDGISPLAEVASGTNSPASPGVPGKFTPPALRYGGVYEYRVQASSPSGTTDWSPWHLFIIQGTYDLGIRPCSERCNQPALINSTAPTLSVSLPDHDGEAVSYTYEVYRGNSASPSSTDLLGTYTANSDDAFESTYVDLPDGLLAGGSTYEFRVRYTPDSGSPAAWSRYMSWTVDTTPPAAPTVTSSTWTSGESTNQASGTISWSSASSDIDKYVWYLDDGDGNESTDTNAPFTVGPGEHTVTVIALDQAGNQSDATDFVIEEVGQAAAPLPDSDESTMSTVNSSGQVVPNMPSQESQVTADNADSLAANATQVYHSSLSGLTENFAPLTTNPICLNPDYSPGGIDENGDTYPDLACPDGGSAGGTSGSEPFNYDYATAAECRDNSLSYSGTGWTKSHYSWCAVGYRKATTKIRRNGKVIARHHIEFRITLVGHGHRGDRLFRIAEYVDDFSCWDIPALGHCWYANKNLTLGIDQYYSPGPSTSCNATHEQPLTQVYGWDGWYNHPALNWTFRMDASLGTTRGDTEWAACSLDPWDRDGVSQKQLYMPSTGTRCDSADYIVRKFGKVGCIFNRVQPVWFIYGGNGSPVKRIAEHIYDAQNGYPSDNRHKLIPEASSFHIPSLLHRIAPAPRRRDSQISAVCERYWPNYRDNDEQCDEYPFNSTRERGSSDSVGPGEYSVRPIYYSQNSLAGTWLGQWYTNDRILDGDPFTVVVYGL